MPRPAPAILLLAALPGFAAAAPDPQPDACRPPEIDHLLVEPPGPGVAEVQRWAVDALGLPEDGAALLRQARGRGALPLIRLKGRYDDGDRRDWDELETLKGRRRDSGYSVELSLEWDLAELSSGTDLFRAAREGRELAELRAAVRAEATALWFDRKRLLIAERSRCAGDAGEALEARLRREEVEASLDALTGGRFLARGAPAATPPIPTSSSAPPGPTPKRESPP